MDVLAPGSARSSAASQREERLEVLDERMAERGIDREHYAWYHDLRRYGTVPHAGRLRPRLRAHPRLCHRPRQRARRDPIPENARKRAVLIRTTGGRELINGRRSRHRDFAGFGSLSAS